MAGKTTLLRMLVDSDEEEDEESSRKSTKSNATTGLTTTKLPTQQTSQTNNRGKYGEDDERFSATRIPDTCNFQPGRIFVNRTNNDSSSSNGNNRFIIRDTLDTNHDEFFNNEKQPSSRKQSTEKPAEVAHAPPHVILEETSCFNEEDEDTYLANFNAQPNVVVNKNLGKAVGENLNSTPLAVKKKLQEHGLLDLTNSPTKLIGAGSPPQKPTTLAITPRKSSVSSDSPTKYIQMRLSPIGQLPLKKTLTDANGKITPIKSSIILLTTPTKSPSLFRLAALQDENNQDKSMDYSFEFRDQLQKNSKNKTTTNTTTITQKPAVKTQQQQTPSAKAKLSTGERNLADVARLSESFLLSPNSKKTTAVSSQKGAKKLKQLTIAFSATHEKLSTTAASTMIPGLQNTNANNVSASTINSNKTKPTASKQIDFDETCLPDDNFSKPAAIADPESTTGNKLYSIKNEPHDQNNADEPEATARTSKSVSNHISKPTLPQEYLDYDKVPKKAAVGPIYKHVEVVRKQDERKKLPTFTCKECEAYWSSVPEHQRPQRIEDSCRHRAKHQAPNTPEHFWSVGFPTTQECIERGYGGVVAQSELEDPTAKRPRRKRPLKLISNEQTDVDQTDDVSDYDFG